MSLPLSKMQPLAERVAEELRGYCARVEIAGSIRRGCAVCGDIDLVVLPHACRGLEILQQGVMALITSADGRRGVLQTNGTKAKRLLLRNSLVQCDLWIAHHGIPAGGDLFNPVPALPGNFGALMLTYTGSVAHNLHVVSTAAARGWRWSPYTGLCIPGPTPDDAPEVISLTEPEIFQRLFGRWIEPADRNP